MRGLACLCIVMLLSCVAAANDSLSTNRPDSIIMLRQVLIEAKAKPVCMRGDTLVYAVPAFATHEGERLRALLKDVPGIEVLADGTIKARGRIVDRLLLNGHELLGLGVGAVLDNLPAGYLQNILLYDDACRHEKETGVYEGASEQVMDLVTTEENRMAWLTDISVGAGTQERYSVNASSGRYSDMWQHMLTGTSDNLPGNFGIGESFYDKLQRSTGTADIRHHNLNGSVSWEKGAWRVQSTAFYDSSHKEDETESLFDAFLNGHSNLSRRGTTRISCTQTVNWQMSVTYSDKNWTLHVDPVLSWNGTDERTTFFNSTYIDNEIVNENKGNVLADDDVLSAGLRFSLNRKLGNRGRNVDLRGHVSLQRGAMSEIDDNNITFLNSQEQSTTRRISYGHSDTDAGSVTLAYIEPLTSCLKLKAEYSLGLSRNTARYPVHLFELGYSGLSDSLSRSAYSDNVQQKARLSLQLSRGRYRLLLGVLMDNNHTHTISNSYRLHIDTVRTAVDWSPELSFYYNGSKGLTLTASYGGRSRQPSIFDLLQGVDTSDPLNVRQGNPGLRPSFVHQVRVSMSHFAVKSQRQINLAVGFDWEQHAITDRVFFDAVRGVRLYRPTNVNGNCSAIANWGLQCNLFGTEHLWLDMQGDFKMSRIVGYQMADYGQQNVSEEELYYSTIQSRLMQYVGVQWHAGGMSLKPYGYLRHDHVDSRLAGFVDQDIFIYGYGTVARYEHSSGLSVSLDAYRHCRAHFMDDRINSKSMLVDIELAYSFLKNRAAEIRLMAYDILRQRDLVDGRITQVGRSESYGESAVNSYYMATLTYRF